MSENTCPKCQRNSWERRGDKFWCLYTECGHEEPVRDELDALREENRRLTGALKKALHCIEVQNMHSWDESNTVEESIASGNWCQMAIDARNAAQTALQPATPTRDGGEG